MVNISCEPMNRKESVIKCAALVLCILWLIVASLPMREEDRLNANVAFILLCISASLSAFVWVSNQAGARGYGVGSSNGLGASLRANTDPHFLVPGDSPIVSLV